MISLRTSLLVSTGLIGGRIGGKIVGQMMVERGQIQKLGKSGVGLHNRWHVNRGIKNPDCKFCNAGEDSAS